VFLSKINILIALPNVGEPHIITEDQNRTRNAKLFQVKEFLLPNSIRSGASALCLLTQAEILSCPGS
jgi:hypothetical protein